MNAIKGAFSMRILYILKWIIDNVKSLHKNHKSKTKAKVDVHQDSVLNPMLFLVTFEALSRELCNWCQWCNWCLTYKTMEWKR